MFKRHLKDNQLGIFFIAPAIILLLIVLVFPLLYAMKLSISSRSGDIVGLSHYARLFASPVFWNSLKQSAIFTAGSVFLHVFFGFLVALLLNTRFRGRAFIRVITLIPWMMAPAIVGVLWRWIYDPQFGMLNPLLQQLGIIDTYLTWTGDPKLAMPAVLLANLWRGFPIISLILLAGLQSIPSSLYEAGKVDGAGAFQQLRYITIPSMSAVLTLSITLDTIWTLRDLDLIFTLTRGGPVGATEVLPVRVLLEFFEFMRFEYASAIGVVMCAILFVFTLIYLKAVYKEVT